MHTDPELLALLALGEQVTTGVDRAHLDSCPTCARELAELSQLVALGRTTPENAMTAPSHDVWARIRAELALDPDLEPPAHRTLFLPSDPLMPPVEPTPPAHKRSLLAAIRSALGSEHGLEYGARLTPTDAEWADASGRAELGTDQHGRRLLTVLVQGDLPTYGVRRGWLVHREDPTARHNLGLMDGPHGLWTVEHQLDLVDYPVLEIVQQDLDETGPAGEVLLRGDLVPA